MSVAFKPFEPPASNEPFGRPGAEPRWSPASKQGVGTALSDKSKVWFTIAGGVLTEVFYPSVDVANIKDLRFLVTDGKSFFDEEGVDTRETIEYIDPRAPGYVVKSRALSGAYTITKRIITDPGANCVVINTAFEAHKGNAKDYRLFVLFAPHIKNQGASNSGRCAEYDGRGYMIAWREDIAAALTCSAPFLNMSAGFSGASDGWHDLKDNYVMDWMYERAEGGNIALTAELPTGSGEFDIVLGFGKDDVEAVIEANKSLERRYAAIEREFVKSWKKYMGGLAPLGRQSAAGPSLYYASAMVLKTHEDKARKGGVIASLSVPWGSAKGDRDAMGYHLVWPRDLVKAALAFMAMGDMSTPLDILSFLRSTQNQDGSWPQNMRLDGTAHWPAVQLDEVALPVILAWRLKGMGSPVDDFYPMVKSAASYIVRNGPVTEQERWEENGGFSPSTLAAEVSALVCAGHWAVEMRETADSEYLLSIADYWASRIEAWTFSECDCLGEGLPGHYLRIVEHTPEALAPADQACHNLVFVKNRPQDAPHHQGDLVDAGFLDLVRYGLRAPDDPHITGSLKVVDKMIRFERGGRTAFYRYNGDGYGEKENGEPFDGAGVGRPWPLITGERAMYELMAGHDAGGFISSMESFANEGLMYPEQIWDRDDLPDKRLAAGKGTGAATPLMWAHAEYIKLLRTIKDKQGCDVIKEVHDRYIVKKNLVKMTAWKATKPIRLASADEAIRVVATEKGEIIWTADNWATKAEEPLNETNLGVHFKDFKPAALSAGATLIFTFRYATGRWDGRDYEIRII